MPKAVGKPAKDASCNAAPPRPPQLDETIEATELIVVVTAPNVTKPMPNDARTRPGAMSTRETRLEIKPFMILKTYNQRQSLTQELKKLLIQSV